MLALTNKFFCFKSFSRCGFHNALQGVLLPCVLRQTGQKENYSKNATADRGDWLRGDDVQYVLLKTHCVQIRYNSDTAFRPDHCVCSISLLATVTQCLLDQS